jgi:hypothetical protein
LLPGSIIPSAPKILAIRRDNIGDFVRTMPLFQPLCTRVPKGQNCALVNFYVLKVIASLSDSHGAWLHTTASWLFFLE